MTIDGVKLGIFALAGACIGLIAKVFINNSEADSQIFATKKALTSISDNEHAILDMVDSASKTIEDISRKENDEIAKRVRKFSDDIRYDARLKAINDRMNAACNAIDKTLGYQDKIARYKADADSKYKQFLDDIRYNSKKSQIHSKIDAANADYEHRKATLSLLFDKDDKLFKDAKKSARRAKESVVEGLENDLKELDSEVKAKQNEIIKERDDLIKDIRDQRNAEVNKVREETRVDIDNVNKEFSKGIERINKEVAEERSDEDSKALVDSHKVLDDARDITNKFYKEGEKIYNNLSPKDKYAIHLAQYKQPKIIKMLIVGIPWFVLVFLGGKYLNAAKTFFSKIDFYEGVISCFPA